MSLKIFWVQIYIIFFSVTYDLERNENKKSLKLQQEIVCFNFLINNYISNLTNARCFLLKR